MVGILLMFLYLWYPLVQAAPGQSGTSPKKITVKGVVLDDAKEPLIGGSVLVKGIEGGTITNVDGKFTIEAPANGVLIFSYIGMDTQEVDIKGRQDIIVTMRSGVVALSDVVVIGYGEASRRTITSSISKVKGDVLSDMSISSPVEGLKGRISGVRVVQTNNTPGGGFSIKVRGGSSVSGKGSGSLVKFSVYGNKYEQNQTDMLGTICSSVIAKHPDKLEEAADALLCIDVKDYTDVAKEDRPVYFSSMNRYEVNGTAYSVGGSFGMKEKLKMIARLLIMCDESKDIIDIEDYEIPDVKVKSAAGTKKKINYFD